MPSVIQQWRLSFLFSIFTFLVVFASAIDIQGQSLLSWKNSLNGSLAVLSNWNPADRNPCGWFGVVCNADEQVIELSIKHVNLLGYVPSNLTGLSSLTTLVLAGTNLSGPIPSQLGHYCPQLILLDLSDNGLTGEIPREIGELGKLRRLLLNSNRLEGAIPPEIGKLSALQWLILYDNQLSGAIPSSIGNLNSLEVLRAGGNKNLEGPLPPEIGRCSNLVMMGLAETSMSGQLPATLGQLKRLETLAIYTALLSGPIPPELGDCTNLQNVYLYENSLSGSVPSQLGGLTRLRNLLLWQNNLVGVIPPELAQCRQLEVIDLSMNSITGSIPSAFGNLPSLQELQLSENQISGRIPTELAGCDGLTHLELDSNQISGEIPAELGRLRNLTLLYLWHNKIEGNIPASIAQCTNLEAIDLSQNNLVGTIPSEIFNLKNLNKLLLLSNNLSGEIPPEIGNCDALVRFRASENRLAGRIPSQIGALRNLNFLDLASNHLAGDIPPEIAGCRNLTFLDLHSNSLSGGITDSFARLPFLQFLDLSDNAITGELSRDIGSLTSLTKMIIGRNRLSGELPVEIGKCVKLQLLDVGGNAFSGEIPATLGKIPSLEIALNLSYNNFSGHIPAHFSGLTRLAVLDVSYNRLTGGLQTLAALQNLVSLNISHNAFSGRLPYTPFFAKLPVSDLVGNPDLCLAAVHCAAPAAGSSRRATTAAMVTLLFVACSLLISAVVILLRGRRNRAGCRDSEKCVGGGADESMDLRPPWEITLYQKLELTATDIAGLLAPANVIGEGWSGVVYKAIIPSSGMTIAVKRFRSLDVQTAAAFSSEIATLAKIRHRNIVRLIGWGTNRKTRLLFYDYLPNGTLGSLLHGGGGGGGGAVVEWETRLMIAQGVAEGLAYLHHGCVPAILHRDVKAYNILLGERYEPCLADFGLARLADDGSVDCGFGSGNPRLAGSCGYMAPEYACMLKITEKSDVYSYGVVLMELITGKTPVDPSFPEGQHIVQWAREHLKSKRDPVEILDRRLQGRPDTQIQEMLQALGIALLCASNRPDDRPTMKDVAALLQGIRHDHSANADAHKLKDSTKLPAAGYCVTPAQLLKEGSSHCSFGYSSSSGTPSISSSHRVGSNRL